MAHKILKGVIKIKFSKLVTNELCGSKIREIIDVAIHPFGCVGLVGMTAATTSLVYIAGELYSTGFSEEQVVNSVFPALASCLGLSASVFMFCAGVELAESDRSSPTITVIRKQKRDQRPRLG